MEGYIIVENAGLNETIERDDIKMVTVPALNMAVAMGNRRASNIILFEVYIGITNAISAPIVEEELEKKFGRKEKGLSLNIDAFRKGAEKASKFIG